MHLIQLSPIQWLGIISGSLVVGLATVVGGNAFLNQSRYNNGIQAHGQANCDLAQSEMNLFLKNSTTDETNDQVARAKAIQSECKLLELVFREHKLGKPDLALANSAKFSQRYQSSPLMTSLRQEATALFINNTVEMLAQETSCNQVETLKNNNLMPQTNQPQFYQACGKALERSGEYSKAIVFYEKFLDQFPGHILTQDVKQDYARALYTETQAKGAGTLPPPLKGGTTGDGSTIVEIRNDSPEKMRIVFGGPTARIEELEPCQDCQAYTNNSPTKCPQKGPVGRYTVDPGQYRIIVKSIGGNTVTPYTGNWSLAANTLYDNCFYIVRRPFGVLPFPDLSKTTPTFE